MLELRFGPVLASLDQLLWASIASVAIGIAGMAVAMAECTRQDPLLPPELLPRPWPGRSARDLVLRSRRLALMVREAVWNNFVSVLLPRSLEGRGVLICCTRWHQDDLVGRFEPQT